METNNVNKITLTKLADTSRYEINHHGRSALNSLGDFLSTEITSDYFPFFLYTMWLAYRRAGREFNFEIQNERILIKSDYPEDYDELFCTGPQEIWRICNDWINIANKSYHDLNGNEIPQPERIEIYYDEMGNVKIKRLDEYQDLVEHLIANDYASRMKDYVVLTRSDAKQYEFVRESLTELDYISYFLKNAIRGYFTYDFFIYMMDDSYNYKSLIEEFHEEDGKLCIKYDFDKEIAKPFCTTKDDLWRIINSWNDLAKKIETNSKGIAITPAEDIVIYYDEEGKVQKMNLDPYPKLLELLLPKVSLKGRKRS